ncbi:MAG: heme exporter protein CcmB [Fidelibacterota bacterium]
MTAFSALFSKDLLVEFRSKEIVVSMIAFGVAVILVYAFAFRQAPDVFARFSPGLLWTVFLFVSVLGLHRSFSLEKEFDAFGLLLSAPVERVTIFLSKWLSACLFLMASQIIIVPLFFLFLGLPFPRQVWAWAVLFVLTDLGITALGSLVSGIVMRVRMSEILLPILLFPLVSPLLIAAVKSTDALMRGLDFNTWRIWPQVLVTFVIAFGVTGYLIFDYVSEE